MNAQIKLRFATQNYEELKQINKELKTLWDLKLSLDESIREKEKIREAIIIHIEKDIEWKGTEIK